MGISEIQCYPPAEIEGVAEMQDTDPTAPLYDKWGLIKKYGFLTLVARSGQADPGLYTQALADEDARWNLEEIIRLISKCVISAPWLPAIPWGSTITIINAAMDLTLSFFIEEHSAGADGDTYTGMTLP